MHEKVNIREIRKYGNRRLYDTVGKCYVNLEEVAQMVREGAEIRVVDAKTGEDLTRSILTQIIVEDTRTRDGGLPLEFLKELVAISGRAQHELLAPYLQSALDTYRRAQRVPADLMRNLLGPTSQSDSEVEQLRRRVAELERRLNDR